ncbi:uncharacterized protein LOC129939771 [Eupeodes corollae]|uniref:uncharacterized protein LOC129939771 n=1 Tax=Eupeodes corollae TaxID=290404 RepID=UPI0024928C99|nr:uncharacterized protein LOC129939771 [Eupeodes corollae]
MSHKSEKAYTHAFQYIEANLMKFRPASFTLNFEHALRKGLTNVFPNAQIHGCWFHYCRAIKRRASKIPNFLKGLRGNKNCNKIFNTFFVLPLLKPENMQRGFEIIQREANGFTMFNNFMEYFQKQWIVNDPLQQFSVYGKSVRTTSSLEACNGKLGKLLPKNGNFFNFVDQLIDEEHTITIDFLASVDRQTWEMFERPKSKFQLRNQLIESMTIKFETDKITLTELLSQLSSICS